MGSSTFSNGNFSPKPAIAKSHSSRASADDQIPRGRAHSHREQPQVHAGNGRALVVRLGIQPGKDVVGQPEMVWTEPGAGAGITNRTSELFRRPPLPQIP